MSNQHGLPEFTFDLGDLPENEPATTQEENKSAEEVQPQDVETTDIPETPVEAQAEQTQDEPAEEAAQNEQIDEEQAERFRSLLGFWKDEGLLNYDGEFKGTKEEFAEILRQQRIADQEAVADAVIGAVPEYAQGLVEYILSEGDTLTMDKLKEFLDISSNAASLPKVETEDSAKAYLMSKYEKLHGKDMATTFIEALEDNGTLVNTAKSELDKDKAEAERIEKQRIEEAKMTKAQRAQAAEQFQQMLATELKATGWKNDVQQAAYNEIYSGNLKNKTAGIVQHPKALIKLANYLRFYDPKTGDINEEAFAKHSFSGAAKQLKDNIDKHFSKSGAFGGGTPTPRKNDKDVQYEFV